MIVKIYKSSFGNYYLMNSPTNGLWHLYFHVPDFETFKIGEAGIGYEEEKTAWENAKEISQENLRLLTKVYKKKDNRKAIYSIIQSIYDVTDEELDNVFNRYPELMPVINKVTEGQSNIEWQLHNIYRDVRYWMQTWDNDEERVIRYMKERVLPRMLYPDHTMVDIRGDYPPNKMNLLYEFYNCGGEEEKLMDEAVEQYPDPKDIDKCYYLFKKKYDKWWEEYKEKLKNKKK